VVDTLVNDWPPNSSDLNPIEQVWALLNRRFGDVRAEVKEDDPTLATEAQRIQAAKRA
jgi:hypothetical protein